MARRRTKRHGGLATKAGLATRSDLKRLPPPPPAPSRTRGQAIEEIIEAEAKAQKILDRIADRIAAPMPVRSLHPLPMSLARGAGSRHVRKKQGRPAKFTDDEFFAAYKPHLSDRQIADSLARRLGRPVNRDHVRYRRQRLGLPPRGGEK